MNTKLRFYLRGLGIGLVVTTLILMAVRLNTHSGELTDAEIRERAAALGMVDGNSYSLTDAVSQGKDEESRLNTDVLDKYNTEKPSETESYGDGEVLLSEESEDAGAENADSDAENSGAENADTGAKNSDTDAANSDAENTAAENTEKEEEKPVNNTQGSVGSGTITIASGSASETAAAVLEKAGIITDAKDFNLYMCRNGYDRRIHPGTYTIDEGLTYEEICKIIAG